MDRGIDTGPIEMVRRVPIQPTDSVERLRKRFEPVMIPLMLEGIRAVRDATLELREQAATEGRQYFALHPSLYAKVRERLRQIAGA
jgi:methionyl-tRNA formyltransferase